MLNTEQFAAANKATFDVLAGLGAKAFDSVEQLTALNLQAARASLDEATEASLAAFSTKDPQLFLQSQAAWMQPNAEKATAYGKQVASIVAGFTADLEKVTTEQAAAAQRSFIALVDAAAKNAPEGTGNGIALFKTAIAGANNAIESVQKAGRQAAETAQANYAAVTGSVAKATAKAKRG